MSLKPLYAAEMPQRAVPVLVVLLVLIALPLSAHAQSWEVHTSFRETTAITALDDAIWAGTSGGVYRYDLATGEKSRYTVAEGLHGVSVTSIAFDEQNDVLWVGYADGVLDRVNVINGTVRSFYDIQRNDRFPTRGVNRLVVHGDLLYVLTQFGIVVYDTDRLEVRDTYSQLGTGATAGASVTDMIWHDIDGEDHLVVTTSEQLVAAPAQSANLQDPAAWRTLAETDGAGTLLSVSAWRDDIYVGAANGVYVWSADIGMRLNQVRQANDVRSLVAADGRLYAADRFAVTEISGSGSARRVILDGRSAPRTLDARDGLLWVGDGEAGAAAVPIPFPADAGVPEIVDIHPDGPYHGLFSEMLVDSDGNLWAAGVQASGTGVYRMTPEGRWTSFVGAEVPEFSGRSNFTRIAEAPNGDIWASSIGSGLAHIARDGDITMYDPSNSPLMGPDPASNYIQMRGVAVDSRGTVWSTSALSNRPVMALQSDGTWVEAPPRCGFNLNSFVPDRIFIDSFGVKWFTVVAATNLRLLRGVLVFDSGASLEDGSDDACRFFDREGTEHGIGLPSIVVNEVTEDRDGRIWLATDLGPAYTTNSRLIAQSEGELFIWPQYADRDEGIYLLHGVRINTVAVDPSNRVWLGTDHGAYLVQDVAGGGFEIVEHLRSADTPLLSDVIQHITIDGSTGIVYFMTDRGLVSYQSSAISPSPGVVDLFVYPNPVRVGAGAPPTVHISGLVEATDLRIVTASGELMASMDTRGGQATWDLRDRSGRIVPSGMYLVIAVGKNGEGRATGKIAVIR